MKIERTDGVFKLELTDQEAQGLGFVIRCVDRSNNWEFVNVSAKRPLDKIREFIRDTLEKEGYEYEDHEEKSLFEQNDDET